MKKIISLFKRDYSGHGARLVYPEIVEGAEWVIAGEGVATTKKDGTPCLIRDGKLYKRYDAKQGKKPPANWEPCEASPDKNSGHWPGWLPIGDGPEDRLFREAWEAGDWEYLFSTESKYPQKREWTYELVGPRINKNPYHYAETHNHFLIPHAAEIIGLMFINPFDVTSVFDEVKQILSVFDEEGIVWWRDISDVNCDKVKIKRRDFGLPWPIVKKVEL